MSSLLFYVIIFALWSIIPALIVAVVLFLRIVSDERRIEAGEMRKLDIDNILATINKHRDELAEVQAKALSINESLQFLNAKWNARMRTESQAEARKEKKEKAKNNGSDGLDGEEVEQLSIPYPGQATPQTQPRRRAFGEFPQY
jgi:hypothetical protein